MINFAQPGLVLVDILAVSKWSVRNEVCRFELNYGTLKNVSNAHTQNHNVYTI